MTIYSYVTAVYYVIVLYFAGMLLWELLTEQRPWMQVAIAIALMPFVLRLLYIK